MHRAKSDLHVDSKLRSDGTLVDLTERSLAATNLRPHH